MHPFRVGHHSTSDDSFAYRPRSEVENWKKTDNPIWRMRRFLEGRKWWDEAAEQEMKERTKKAVMAEYRRAEELKRHPLGELFTDVYGGEMPWHLVSLRNRASLRTNRLPIMQKEQREELSGLLKKYGDVWEPWRKEKEKFKGNAADLQYVLSISCEFRTYYLLLLGSVTSTRHSLHYSYLVFASGLIYWYHYPSDINTDPVDDVERAW